MAWIKSHQELRDHPKTRKLAHVLGISRPAAIGHLQCLWWWCLDYADDGDLSRFDAIDIALGADWEGDSSVFVDTLVRVGFLDKSPTGALVVHDWDDYAGALVRRRVANTERMKQARAQHVRAHTSTDTQHVRGLEKSREEKSREEKRTTAKIKPEPQPASDANASTAEPSRSISPFSVLSTMCDQLGSKAGDLPERERGKQLAVAKRLIADGVTLEDVGAMTAWLQDQSWLTGGIDLFTLANQRSKWVLAGKPSAVAQRAPKLPANAAVENRRDEPDLWLKGWGETSSDQANKKVGAA